MREATMVQQGDRVDVLGGGTVVTVYGPASKRMASVKTDGGSYVEVECTKCTVLPPAFKVGDWVTARADGNEEMAQVKSITRIDQTTWHVGAVTMDGSYYGAFSRECTPATASSSPLARFTALIADAETCALDGAATEQAKCIAALAKALREALVQGDEAKRTLRSIVEMVR